MPVDLGVLGRETVRISVWGEVGGRVSGSKKSQGAVFFAQQNGEPSILNFLV